MAFANPSTFVAGEVLTAAQMNVLANNDRFFHGPPTVKLIRTSDLDTVNNVNTTIAWQTEDYDSDAMWSSTAAGRIDFNTAGKYLIVGTVSWTDGSTLGTRDVRITDNLTNIIDFVSQEASTGTTSVKFSLIQNFTSTQSITVQARQISGTTGPNIFGSATIHGTHVEVLWVSS